MCCETIAAATGFGLPRLDDSNIRRGWRSGGCCLAHTKDRSSGTRAMSVGIMDDGTGRHGSTIVAIMVVVLIVLVIFNFVLIVVHDIGIGRWIEDWLSGSWDMACMTNGLCASWRRGGVQLVFKCKHGLSHNNCMLLT